MKSPAHLAGFFIARIIHSSRYKKPRTKPGFRAHPEKCETVFGKDARQNKRLERDLIQSDRRSKFG
ncbi:hypothetical protein BSU07_07360 [Brucella melitensis]|uniref:Uncharacterized protein n=1 Tax=Brucella melitensis TaxID=29459 RepID=A0AB36PX21_BRUML|nr:hypothetical protein BSU07_07360 [Brucella melitensis]OZV63024.1 hypothetical protein BI318_05140 [Brucella melitensis]PAO83043.1 hypothetical protein CJU93_08115 [Brucella melitensis]PHL02366.1 hypothetical protein BSU05_06475 [Brucella melitensis]